MADTGSNAGGQSLIHRHRNLLTALLLAVAAWMFLPPLHAIWVRVLR